MRGDRGGLGQKKTRRRGFLALPNHPSIHAAESAADGGTLGLPRVPLGPRWEARRPHVSWVF